MKKVLIAAAASETDADARVALYEQFQQGKRE